MTNSLFRVEKYQEDSLVPFRDAEVMITPLSSKGNHMSKIEFNKLRNDIFKQKKFIPPTISAFRSPVPTANYYDED